MLAERERLEIEAGIMSYTMKDGVPQYKWAFPMSRLKLSFIRAQEAGKRAGESIAKAAKAFESFVNAAKVIEDAPLW